MLYQIITNLDNGAGLQKDYEILRAILESAGHTVNPVHFHRPHLTVKKADVNIFLEVLVPSALRFGERNWMVPNSEWWGAKWNSYIPYFDKVLCKTADCYCIWESRAQTEMVGWLAQDLYDPSITKEPVFLHTAGKSLTKNTAAVLEAWKRFALPYPLIVSAFKPEIAAVCRGVKNVTLVNRFTTEERDRVVNRCQFFLMPSKYEGFGHAIHEALGCKSVVLTTDASPMNSFSGIMPELLIPVERTQQMSLATVHLASPQGIAEQVRHAVSLPAHHIQSIGNHARDGFLKDNATFMERIGRLIQ